MIDDYDDIRGALATLIAPEPPMSWSVADDVRRGRVRQARRQRWAASGMAAALVIGALAFVGIPRLAGTSAVRRPAAPSPAENSVNQAIQRLVAGVEGMGFSVGPLSTPDVAFKDGRTETEIPIASGSNKALLRVTFYPKRSQVGDIAALCDDANVGCSEVRKPLGTLHFPHGDPSLLDIPASSPLGQLRVLDWLFQSRDARFAPRVVEIAVGPATLGAPFFLNDQQLILLAQDVGDPYAVDSVIPRYSVPDLIGYWKIKGTAADDGSMLVIGREISVWRPCGIFEGFWRATTAGAFISAVSMSRPGCDGDAPTWLVKTATYRLVGGNATLLDASGNVTAQLTPGERPSGTTYGSSADAILSALTAQETKDLNAGVVNGLKPAGADQLVGRWIPTAAAADSKSYLTLSEDGSYQTSDGCNIDAGRWAVDPTGRLVATDGYSTQIGCDNTDVQGWLVSAVEATVAGDRMSLIDSSGKQLGTFLRS